MHRFRLLILLSFLVCLCPLGAAEYKMIDGTTLLGEPFGPNELGIVLRSDGKLSERHSWAKFSQETLKQLAQDPKMQPFVMPFIELPPEERQKAKRPEIVLMPVPRLEAPEAVTFLSAITQPGMLALLALLYLTNLYAAYEIAVYRGKPVGVVAGLAAVAPVIGPLAILYLPGKRPEPAAPVKLSETPEVRVVEKTAPAAEGEAAPDTSPETIEEAVSAPAVTAHPSGLPMTEDELKTPGLTLTLKKPEPIAEPLAPQTFKRGEFTMNRRFFETRFPGFFRMVPQEPEKSSLLIIKAVRGEYAANRISRISNEEVHLQTRHGEALDEVRVPFIEIIEVQLRPNAASS